MIKALLFDLDGTLCDSDTAWYLAETETFQLLRKHYPDIPGEVITTTWAAVHRKLFQHLDAGKMSMATVRDTRFRCLFNAVGLPTCSLTEELNDFLSRHYLENLRLYDDVAVLEKLRAYHVGIVTNGAADEHTDSQLSKVRHLGLIERIQSLTISDEVGVRKPNHHIFDVACERAGVLPKEAVFIGDSIQNDIVGANSVGMTTVHINRKSDRNSISKTTDECPDYVISTLHGILHYV